jgi:hypothetical protein
MSKLGVGMRGRLEESMFFFEKKKTMLSLPALKKKGRPLDGSGQQARVFWFFFSKKNCFLP